MYKIDFINYYHNDECQLTYFFLFQKKILASRESLLDDNIVVSDTDDIDVIAQVIL